MSDPQPYHPSYRAETVPVVAHAQGREAARCGESRLENPYRPGSTCHCSWEKGYDSEWDRLRSEAMYRGDRE